MQCLSRDFFRPDALDKGGIQAGLTPGSFAALLLLMRRKHPCRSQQQCNSTLTYLIAYAYGSKHISIKPPGFSIVIPILVSVLLSRNYNSQTSVLLLSA